jgi:hypothetical protein
MALKLHQNLESEIYP